MLELRKTTRTAFTLIELMVSIFLLMLVMIGVNTVFTTSSGAIGAGQAQSTIIRDSRAAQAVFGRDFTTMYADYAPLVIRSEQFYQFNSIRDEAGDADKNAVTFDGNQDGDELDNPGADRVLAVDYGSRSHRRDRIAFFTQQSVRRQTANDGQFTVNQSGREAWVWLGHVRVPDNSSAPGLLPDAAFQNPGEGTRTTNPNNYFAQQWILGRWATLLVEPTVRTGDTVPTGGIPGYVYAANGTKQDYIYRSNANPLDLDNLAPLVYGSNATQSGILLQDTRFDVAGTSCAGYKKILVDCLSVNPTREWWTEMMTGPTTRFRCVPFAPRPLSAAGMSQTVPVMATGCTQFMVEFAGDFVSQNATGAVVDCYFDAGTGLPKPTGQDGQIDYFVTNPGTANENRQIRWYGMPRSTTNNITLTVNNGDVAPLRDTIRLAGGAYASLNAPIEKTGGSGGVNVLASAVPANYRAAMTGTNGYFYTTAWGPADTVRPKLIRIVMTLEDPEDRLPGGQTFEYVFAVP